MKNIKVFILLNISLLLVSVASAENLIVGRSCNCNEDGKNCSELISAYHYLIEHPQMQQAYVNSRGLVVEMFKPGSLVDIETLVIANRMLLKEGIYTLMFRDNGVDNFIVNYFIKKGVIDLKEAGRCPQIRFFYETELAGNDRYGDTADKGNVALCLYENQAFIVYSQ